MEVTPKPQAEGTVLLQQQAVVDEKIKIAVAMPSLLVDHVIVRISVVKGYQTKIELLEANVKYVRDANNKLQAQIDVLLDRPVLEE